MGPAKLVRLSLIAAGLAWSSCPLAGAHTPASDGYQVEWGVAIPMRDGVLLNATVYRPREQSGRLPVVMTMTPYVADRFHAAAAFFAQHGYVFATVDSRGRGNSGGEFQPWVNEGHDGYDAIEWLARQAYSDGQTAMWGGSYGGKNQWAVASLSPPSLRTIVPASAGYVGYDVPMRRNIPMPWMLQYLSLLSGRTSNRNLYEDDDFWNRSFEELSAGAVSFRDFEQITGLHNPWFAQWVDHPQPDAFWDAANPGAEALRAIEIPVLTITGAYDDAQTGALEFRHLHLDGASVGARRGEYTLVGPWDHGGTRDPSQTLGGLDFGPQSRLDVLSLHVSWYDWVMKSGPRPGILSDRFVYYVAGAGVWEAAPDMPAPSGPALYLSSSRAPADALARRGELARRPPRRDADHYRYDPATPARNEGVEARWAVSDNYLTDPRSFAVLDGDGLIYDSEAFDRPVRLVGRPVGRLFLSLDAPDTDIRVQLFEALADGSVVFLGQDQLRVRYRLGPRRAELATPGRIEPYLFDQFPFIARELRAGSRLRLVISPLGMSIHQQRNRNSGGVVADETARDNRAVVVSVALGAGLSHINVPLSEAVR